MSPNSLTPRCVRRCLYRTQRCLTWHGRTTALSTCQRDTHLRPRTQRVRLVLSTSLLASLVNNGVQSPDSFLQTLNCFFLLAVNVSVSLFNSTSQTSTEKKHSLVASQNSLRLTMAQRPMVTTTTSASAFPRLHLSPSSRSNPSIHPLLLLMKTNLPTEHWSWSTRWRETSSVPRSQLPSRRG